MEFIYQDSEIIVLNKPPGVSVHGGGSVSGPTVVDFLLVEFPEIAGVGEDPSRPGIVHRLDRDTSGVMVVARNQDAFLKLKKLFQTRAMIKLYRAIVCGAPAPASGVIDRAIGRIVKNPTKRGVESVRGAISGVRPAITEYRTIKSGSRYSLIELRPKTGRMHQLRVHLAAIGRPIACDTKYGGRNVCCPVGCSRQLLHAQSLSFSMAPGRVQTFEADPPEDFALAMEKII
ncbi:MAG: RluA family pseudouridine synthase [Candidatus Sungbacteria bacterium]|uniref:RluA family pseudouridine synthase n=1 Tax=Candidatus Sungiibacteriota bacterium TaxID=2750080 RepID=A0A932VS27_9BACT|nr:RluA family pseudouridine synthase [Candidatus Sungbacteria bacterium]